jgi:hypothetical protein
VAPAPLPFFAPIAASAAFAREQQLGVVLYDGVGELGLAGLLDPFSSSLTNRPYIMAPVRAVVQPRHGLVFLPGYDFRTVPALDRALVAAGTTGEAKRRVVTDWSAMQPGRPAEDIYQAVGLGETAYDASLKDLARQNGVLARAEARGLVYRIDPSQLAETGWPVGQLLAPLAPEPARRGRCVRDHPPGRSAASPRGQPGLTLRTRDQPSRGGGRQSTPSRHRGRQGGVEVPPALADAPGARDPRRSVGRTSVQGPVEEALQRTRQGRLSGRTPGAGLPGGLPGHPGAGAHAADLAILAF